MFWVDISKRRGSRNVLKKDLSFLCLQDSIIEVFHYQVSTCCALQKNGRTAMPHFQFFTFYCLVGKFEIVVFVTRAAAATLQSAQKLSKMMYVIADFAQLAVVEHITYFNSSNSSYFLYVAATPAQRIYLYTF